MGFVTVRRASRGWVTIHRRRSCSKLRLSFDEHASFEDAARHVMQGGLPPWPCGKCFPETLSPAGFCRWTMDFAVRASVPKERPKLTMICGAYCPDQAEHEELEKEIESIWSMVHKAGPSPTEPDLTVLAGCENDDSVAGSVLLLESVPRHVGEKAARHVRASLRRRRRR